MASVILSSVHTRLLKSPTILGQSAVAASHTGNTTETVLATIAIAAAAMGPNGVLRWTSLWSYTNNANTKTVRGRLGGLSGTAFQNVAVTTSASLRDQRWVQNRNSQSSQVATASQVVGGIGVSGLAVTTGTIDTSAAQNLVFTAQLGNAADTITLEAYLVELIYGA